MSRLSIRAARAWLAPGGVLDDALVVCQDGLIASVARADGGTADVELDGVLLPAAADRHVHVGLSDPAAILARGVTAVRDLAWPADAIFPLADLSEAPSFDGPLIRGCGPMLTAPGGYPMEASWAPPGTGREVVTPDDAARAVRELAAAGATAVKVSLNADAGPVLGDGVLAAICDAAHEHELLVTAHVQGAGQAQRAIGAGVDEFAHTPWTERLSDDLIRICAARVRIVSTLDIQAHGARTEALDVAIDNLRRFHDAGGNVIYGTDLGNGPISPGIHTLELRWLEEAGLTNDEILAALTRAPIELGAPADLIGLARDPLADLGAFDDVRLVIRAGRIVTAA